MNDGKCPICVFSSSGGIDIVTVTNLNNAFDTLNYNIVLKGVKNPKAAIPMSAPVCSSYVGISLGDTVTPAININFTPLISTATVTMTSSPPKNGEFADLSASFVTSMPIPINGGFRLTCPFSNKDFVTLGINSVSMLPTNLSMTAAAIFTSSTGVNIPLGALNVVGNSSTQTVQVFFSNAAELTTGGTLALTISQLLNPPSLAPLTGFKLETALVKNVSGTNTMYAIEQIDNANIKLTNTQVSSADASSSASINPVSPLSAEGATY